MDNQQIREALPSIKANPIVWVQDDKDNWSESTYGFHFYFDDGEYVASWGEGDTETFSNAEDAKEWCQDTIDSYIKSVTSLSTSEFQLQADKVAELEAKLAQYEYTLPETPEECVNFIGTNFNSMYVNDENGVPFPDREDIRYSLTVHDLLSSFFELKNGMVCDRARFLAIQPSQDEQA